MAPTKAEIRAQLLRHAPSWLNEPAEVMDAMLEIAVSVFERVYGSIHALHDRTFLDLADGDWLNEHGNERLIPRTDPTETDVSYRPRIKGIEDKVTVAAIAAGVDRVLTNGTSEVREHLPEASFATIALLAPYDGSLEYNWPAPAPFSHEAIAYEVDKSLTVFIKDQAAQPNDTAFAAPKGFFDDSRSFAWVAPVTGTYPQPGSFAEADELSPSTIYSRIYREVDRLRAAGVAFRIQIQ